MAAETKKELPNQHDNVGITDMDRSKVFFNEFPQVLPTFLEWSEKARALQPEAFTKPIVKKSGEGGYCYEFVWDQSEGPQLRFFTGYVLGTKSGDTLMTEEQAVLLGKALAFSEKAIVEAESLVRGRIAKSDDQAKLVQDNFVVAESSGVSKNVTSGPTPNNRTIKYRARIGIQDLQNSKGVFLPSIPSIKARDILLQDRFNYHQKSVRDPEDTNEGLYEEGKDTMRKFFEGKVARLADGGDPMPLLSSQPVVDVTLTESEIIVTPAK